jgi:hypothetical protein
VKPSAVVVIGVGRGGDGGDNGPANAAEYLSMMWGGTSRRAAQGLSSGRRVDESSQPLFFKQRKHQSASRTTARPIWSTRL